MIVKVKNMVQKVHDERGPGHFHLPCVWKPWSITMVSKTDFSIIFLLIEKIIDRPLSNDIIKFGSFSK